MLSLKVGNDKLLIIIDPGNVRMMKELKPLVINTIGVTEIAMVFTPDIIEFGKQLKMPVSDKELDALLRSCQTLPEKEPPMVVDGNARNITH